MKKGKIVFTGAMARNLLKKGYTIIDVKPHRDNKIASVFVFQDEEGLMEDIRELAKKE